MKSNFIWVGLPSIEERWVENLGKSRNSLFFSMAFKEKSDNSSLKGLN